MDKSGSDARYKRLFNEARMVEELLRGFAPDEFLRAVDFGTLGQSGGDFADDGLGSRRADRVWRVRSKEGGDWMYLYIVLEFQSRPDRMMAKRVLEYVLRLRDQAEGERAGRGRARTLPPVLPAVIHNGRETWTAPEDYLDLVESGGEWLLKYQTRQRYALVDLSPAHVERYPEGNALRTLCAMADPDASRLGSEISALARAASGPELAEFRKAFAEFLLLNMAESRTLPREISDALKELGEMPELEELGSIFEGNFDRAIARVRNEGKNEGRLEGKQEGRLEGKQEGRLEGKQEGRLEGKLETLNRLVLKKFGAAGQGELPGLVAGIRGDSRLDDAFDYLLECGDPGQFASFLKRNSNGG